MQLNSAKPVKVARPIVLSVRPTRACSSICRRCGRARRVAHGVYATVQTLPMQGVDRRSARRRQRADGVAHHARRSGPALTRASSSSGAKRRSCRFSSHHVAPASAYSAHIDRVARRRVAVAGDVEAVAAADRLRPSARARPASSSSLRSRRCSRPSRPSARRGAAPATLLPPIQIGPSQSSRTDLQTVVEQLRAAVRVEVLAERGELLLVAAEAGAEHDATAVQAFERGELLRDDLWPPARQRRDRGAERELLGRGRDGRERQPRIGGRRPHTNARWSHMKKPSQPAASAACATRTAACGSAYAEVRETDARTAT